MPTNVHARAASATPSTAVADVQRIVYASSAARPWDDSELDAVLVKWRRNNAQCGITGMLVYHDENFLQLIEGPGPALNQLFSKLRGDPRHQKVVLLLRERIIERTFTDWPMGYARISVSEVQNVPGMTDFAQRRMSLQRLAPRRAVMFLTAFRSGLFTGAAPGGRPVAVPEDSSRD